MKTLSKNQTTIGTDDRIFRWLAMNRSDLERRDLPAQSVGFASATKSRLWAAKITGMPIYPLYFLQYFLKMVWYIFFGTIKVIYTWSFFFWLYCLYNQNHHSQYVWLVLYGIFFGQTTFALCMGLPKVLYLKNNTGFRSNVSPRWKADKIREMLSF